ncbi:MAG: hypothetical protein JSS97_09470 [Actinobacteria bacterium]|nr:hypothetical protein [Actinomycetota bacterium]
MSRDLHHGTLGVATSLVATVSFGGAITVAIRDEPASAAEGRWGSDRRSAPRPLTPGT